jgi:hypothetical protein
LKVTLDSAVLEKLSPRGMLAYIAYSLNKKKAASPAKFAALVRIKEEVMAEGLQNLWANLPEVQNLDPKPAAKKEFVLPAWVPPTTWNAYVQMRRGIGKPMTEQAMAIAVNKLAKLKDEGYKPTEVLDQSIFNSWQGLFPVKTDGFSVTANGAAPVKLRETEFKL